MSIEAKPYVVSADTKLLLRQWEKESGYTVPNSSYLDGMIGDLESVLCTIFPDSGVEIVGDQEISNGLNKLAQESPYPILSMDRVYVNGQTPNLVEHLDVTRAVSEAYDSIGLMERPGSSCIEEQIEKLRSPEISPIAILDDVIFEGKDLVDTIIPALRKVNRPVNLVLAGIGIKGGLARLREAGVTVRCVREYPNGVEDEICQRDFTACIPMSGRTLIDGENRKWSAPYFKPFGDIEKWASIPSQYVHGFSEFCLIQSILLWERIESLSQTSIPTEAVPRKIKGLRNSASIVKALSEYIDTLK